MHHRQTLDSLVALVDLHLERNVQAGLISTAEVEEGGTSLRWTALITKSSMKSALRSQVNCLMNSFPERANRILRSSLLRRRQRFLARASRSSRGESKPVTPFSRYSRCPPMSVATTAQPQAAPSAGGSGNPSARLGLNMMLEPL